MCWPRSLCCYCPRPSSFPWPPSLTFGRFPRRPPPAPVAFPSWWAPPQPTPPSAPVIPPSSPPRGRRRRRVRFKDRNAPPPLVDGPPVNTTPFLTPTSIAFPPWSPALVCSPAWSHLSPELCSPRGAYPYLDWDITCFPSTAKRCTTPSAHQTLDSLDGPATFPSTRLLTISYADTDNPILMHWESHWGPIFARGQGAHAVTVENVLDAIYTYFNQPLSHADRAALSGPAWDMVSEAYYRRLPQSPNLGAYDVSRGALRLDVLNSATKFCGLQLVGRDYLRLMLSAW
ncbi:hypothetical protein B0H16DRAFT_1387705 [Mycena metata]|uniref:DUF6699 domain-containing protein n=1 Tax=Mycena metata TaxID=1033252 RepID=A0AAD7MJ13_9AGAR|nr:hypothetical protein B0H16DRAFT_1387705 [Mycena metata]